MSNDNKQSIKVNFSESDPNSATGGDSGTGIQYNPDPSRRKGF